MSGPTVLCQLGQGMADQILERFPDVDVVVVPGEGEVPSDLTGVRSSPPAGRPQSPRVLRHGVSWVHNVGTGVDRFPLDALLDGQVLTCSRGASALAISEWVMAQLSPSPRTCPPAGSTSRPSTGTTSSSTPSTAHTLGSSASAGSARDRPPGRAVRDGDRAYRRTDAPPPRPSITIVDDVIELAAWADHLVLAAALTDEPAHRGSGPAGRRQARPAPREHRPRRPRRPGRLGEALDDGRIGARRSTPSTPSRCPRGTGSTTTPP